MRCHYCYKQFDGRQHKCPKCGKDRHYSGPRKKPVATTFSALGFGLVVPMALAAMSMYEMGRKKGHEEAKAKLEELA